MSELTTIEQQECLRCGHKWYPNSPKKPTVCPRCKSPYWDRPKEGSNAAD